MTILVTGATGNIGRLVVDELLTLGAPDMRALTNNPAKAALPETLTRAERAQGIGRAPGRDPTYVEQSHDETIAQLTPMMGDSPPGTSTGRPSWSRIRSGRRRQWRMAPGGPARRSPGTTFARWVTANADLFR